MEWVHPDGSRDLRNCPEDISLQEAYEQVLSQRASSAVKRQKRKHGTAEPLCVKPTPPAAVVGIENTTTSQDATDITDYACPTTLNPPLSKGDQESNNVEEDCDDSVAGNHNKADKAMVVGSTIPEICFSKPVEATAALNSSISPHPSPQQQESLAAQPLTNLEEAGPHGGKQMKIVDENYHNIGNDDRHHDHHQHQQQQQSRFRFFIRHPHMRGSTRVLVPFSPTDCLANALSGQVVLEFPTVQVFPLNVNIIRRSYRIPDFYSLKQDAARKVVDMGSEVTIGAQNGAGGGRQDNDDEIGKGSGEMFEDKAMATVSYTSTLHTDGTDDEWDLPDGYVVVSRT